MRERGKSQITPRFLAWEADGGAISGDGEDWEGIMTLIFEIFSFSPPDFMVSEN